MKYARQLSKMNFSENSSKSLYRKLAFSTEDSQFMISWKMLATISSKKSNHWKVRSNLLGKWRRHSVLSKENGKRLKLSWEES